MAEGVNNLSEDQSIAIDVRDAVKRYGDFTALKKISLSIMDNEFFTLLGPSGCGKTTLLRMIAGFEEVTEGEIFLFGQEIENLPPHQRPVNTVFQNYALFPHMTVAENLSFPLEVRKIGKTEREERVQLVLDMVQMGAFGGRRPAQLSGGQQQRVALARALVFEAELVLMDEPLGALDKQLREHMQFEIKRIADNLGITVVYVTHDQTEALTMSDRVAVFEDGRIQQLAPPDVLYEEPENSFVAQFIGENNTLEGVVREINGDRALVELDGGDLIDCKPINVNLGIDMLKGHHQIVWIVVIRYNYAYSFHVLWVVKFCNFKIFCFMGNIRMVPSLAKERASFTVHFTAFVFRFASRIKITLVFHVCGLVHLFSHFSTTYSPARLGISLRANSFNTKGTVKYNLAM